MPRITIHAVYRRKASIEPKLNLIELQASSMLDRFQIERIATSHIKHFDYTLEGYKLVQLVGHETKDEDDKAA